MSTDAKSIFTMIYDTNYWKSPESKSGSGSELRRTIHACREIAYLLADLNIKTMIDAPCGDFNWMQHINLTGIDYLGIDVVDGLIKENQHKYSKEHIRFASIDVINEPIPCVDLILSRAFFFYHLPNKAIKKVLNNFKRSNSTYLLMTNHSWHMPNVNRDIIIGDFRRINLESQPFCLPPPLRTIVEGNDEGGFEDTILGLWKLSDLNFFEE